MSGPAEKERWKMSDKNKQDEQAKQEQDKKSKESDTVAASIVREVGGDKAADDFKKIFGDWF